MYDLLRMDWLMKGEGGGYRFGLYRTGYVENYSSRAGIGG